MHLALAIIAILVPIVASLFFIQRQTRWIPYIVEHLSQPMDDDEYGVLEEDDVPVEKIKMGFHCPED